MLAASLAPHKLVGTSETLQKSDFLEQSDRQAEVGTKINTTLQACTQRYQNELFSEKTQTMYRTMLLGMANEVKRLTGVAAMEKIHELEENIGFLDETLAKARAYEARFKSLVSKAVSCQGLSKDRAREWQEAFDNPNVLELERKAYLEKEFFSKVQRWIEIGEERKKLKEDPRMKKLSSKDIVHPQASKFLDDAQFSALHYPDKESLLEAVKDALRMEGKTDGMKTLHAQAKTKLKPLEGKCISSAASWLDRIFSRSDIAEKQMQDFLTGEKKDDLPALIGRWQTVAKEFSTVQGSMRAAGVPNHLRSLSLSQFLRLHYDERVERVHGPEGYNQILAQWKIVKNVDQLMNDEQFDTAEIELKKAESSIVLPDFRALLSRMKIHLRHDRQITEANPPEVKPPRTVEDVEEEIDHMIETEAPPSTKFLLHQVKERKRATVRTWRRAFFNEQWARGRGYLDDDLSITLHNQAERVTADIAHTSQNHRRRLENVDMQGAKRPDKSNTLRDYDNGIKAATVVHVEPNEQWSFLDECEEHEGNTEWEYWMTPVNHGIPQADKQYLVNSGFNHRLERIVGERDELRAQRQYRNAQFVSAN